MATEKDIKIIHGKICLTSSALYELLEINESTLVRWGQKGCPKVERGWWDLFAVLRWRGVIGTGLKTSENIKERSLQEQKLYAETKLKEAQLEATDLKNAISRGDYIAKTEIVSELQRYFIMLKRSMLSYSRKIATELSPFIGKPEARRIEKLVNDLTINVLEQLSINGVYDAKKTPKNIKKAKS